MSDTLGSLIDKLNTVGLKSENLNILSPAQLAILAIDAGFRMFKAQDEVYYLDKMSEEEWEKAFANPDGIKILRNKWVTACSLNKQRQAMILEFDQKIVQLIKEVMLGKDVDGIYVQNQHKNYLEFSQLESLEDYNSWWDKQSDLFIRNHSATFPVINTKFLDIKDLEGHKISNESFVYRNYLSNNLPESEAQCIIISPSSTLTVTSDKFKKIISENTEKIKKILEKNEIYEDEDVCYYPNNYPEFCLFFFRKA